MLRIIISLNTGFEFPERQDIFFFSLVKRYLPLFESGNQKGFRVDSLIVRTLGIDTQSD